MTQTNDVWFLQLTLVDVDMLARSPNHEIRHYPPFPFGGIFKDTKSGWWDGGIVETDREGKVEARSHRVSDG